MNVLYLTNHLNIGGITSYVLSLATGFKKRGHNVYIASSGGELISRFIAEGIVYIRIPTKTKQEFSPTVLISLFKLLKYINEKEIHIVHSNTRVTQVLGCFIQRFSGIPHISTCHGFFKARFSRKIFPCWGKKVIAISEAVKEHLVLDFGLRHQDIRVIYNGIDIDKFKILPPKRDPAKGGENAKIKIEAKDKFGLGESPVVGIVARLSDVKGHIYLIQAMKNVLEKIPDVELLIVGEGRMKEDLINLTGHLGIEKNVFFVPSVMDTSDALSAMDLFVLPSLQEGLGLSIMEAMAAGLAVVGSDIGGLKSLIRHGHNGLLVKPADVEGLSCAILELLKDPQKRTILGSNARDFIKQNFSQNKMVTQTERVYLECLRPQED